MSATRSSDPNAALAADGDWRLFLEPGSFNNALCGSGCASLVQALPLDACAFALYL